MDRAIFFIDGSNWYHSLKEIGLDELGRLRYARLCQKLVGPRTWLATRFYTAPVGPIGNAKMLADQRAFLAQLQAEDPRITVHYGRLEARKAESVAAKALLEYLGGLKVRLPIKVYKDLVGIGRANRKTQVFVEKAVDVQITVDMLSLAFGDEFETAYLLSADGDYTPVVEAVRAKGKKVFAVSPAPCAKLAAAADTYIRLRKDWFEDCFRR